MLAPLLETVYGVKEIQINYFPHEETHPDFENKIDAGFVN